MYIYNTQLLVYCTLTLYLAGAIVSILFYKLHKLSNILSNSLSCIGAIIGIFASINHLLSGNSSLSLGNITTTIPFISFKLNMDKLSAFFILTLSVLVLCVSIYSMGYISHYYQKRNVGLFNFLLNTFIVSMILVFISGNMLFFLVSWEIMSLVSYFLVVFENEQKENQKAGLIYLIMTHIATAFITIAFILIYRYNNGLLDLGVTPGNAPAIVKNIIFICFLIGFGTKAGIIPLHIWLPYAHPSAPSNVSALMSGIMIKTAIYGLIRFILGTMGAEYQWWGIALVVLGAISTVFGVAYAVVEQNIKKLLAYSSIENIGIILIGLGISFYAYASGNVILSSISMLAALLHVFNHTLFKGSLFLGAGAIHYSTHTKDMEKLGGLIKKMPYTAIFFLIASLSISAIPTLNGFVSEWLTYQSLFSSIGFSPAGVKFIIILTVASLAIAGAFAATSFVKCFGISFLALPRSKNAEEAKEVPSSMLIGMGILSALCVAFGVFPLLILKLLDKVNLSLFNYPVVPDFKGTSFFIYYPVKLGLNSISPLFAALMGVLIAAFSLIIIKILAWKVKERKYGTWDCGFPGLNSRMQYSATGFSKPIRIIFRAIYRPTRELHVEGGTSPYFPKSMRYIVSTQSVIEKYFYIPITKYLSRFARKIRLTIQTGSVHTYLIYIFISIVILLIYYGLN